MGGGDGAAFKRPGDGARLQRVLGLGSRRAPRSLPAGGPAPRRTAPPPPGHASAGPAAMSSHIAKSESKTSLLKAAAAAAASGGSRAPRHGPARDPGLPSRRLTGSCPGTPQSSGDPSSRRPLCRPAPREEGARGSQRGLPQAHCRPREALPAAASRPSPSSPLPPARGRDGEERGLSPALGFRGSLRAPGRGDSVPAAASEADPFLHRLRPMLSSAFGQVRAAPPVSAPGKGARDPAGRGCASTASSCGPWPPSPGSRLGSPRPPRAGALAGTPPRAWFSTPCAVHAPGLFGARPSPITSLIPAGTRQSWKRATSMTLLEICGGRGGALRAGGAKPTPLASGQYRRGATQESKRFGVWGSREETSENTELLEGEGH